MTKRRWRDLSPRARRFIVVTGLIEAVLKAIALRDLRHRPPEMVRGKRSRWALAITVVNSFGGVPLAYLVFGRRRHR